MAAAPTAEVTSHEIYEAITSLTPKTRYPCSVVDDRSTPASLVKWIAWLLPDRVKDAILIAGLQD